MGKAVLSTIFPVLVFVCPMAYGLQISSIEANADVVGLYRPYRVHFSLSRSFTNPYDPRDIDVSFEFTGPSGTKRTIPAFWDGTKNRWEARIVPLELGNHTGKIVARAGSGELAEAIVSFQSIPSSEKGFIRVDSRHPYALRFDNGSPYIPLGHNLCWSIREPIHFERMDRMRDVRENWTRYWMSSFVGQDIEWGPDLEPAYRGLGNYSPSFSDFWDAAIDGAQDRGIYVQYCLDSFNGWNIQLFANWNISPYNSANGGPLGTPIEYFTNEEARRLARQRYRYIVARWAYRTSVLCWELFNEVDALGAGFPWNQTYSGNRPLGAEWHRDMARYIRSIDPFDHLITTSFAHHAPFDEVWELPEMDIVQIHQYSVALPDSHIDLVRYARRYGKPIILGEANSSGAPEAGSIDIYKMTEPRMPLYNDPNGGTLHSLIWAAAVVESGAMSWWWDGWIHSRNLYYHFDALARYLDGEDWGKWGMDMVDARLYGSPSDLRVFGTAGENAAFLYVHRFNSGTLPDFAIELPQVTASSVEVEYWETGGGSVVHSATIERGNQTLRLNVPQFQWDIAIKVKGESKKAGHLHLR